MCKGGKGHLLHKREVVRQEGEEEMAEKGERREKIMEKSGGGGEGEEEGCKAFLWLGEPAPPPPKARLLSSVSQSRKL